MQIKLNLTYLFKNDKPLERTLPQTLPNLVELSALNETNVVLTLPGAHTSMMNMNSYYQPNNSACANIYEKVKKDASRLFHGSANEETGKLTVKIMFRKYLI